MKAVRSRRLSLTAVLTAVLLSASLCGCGMLNITPPPAPPSASSEVQALTPAVAVSAAEELSEEPVAEKTFFFKVVDPDGNETEYEMKSTALTVGEALLQEGLIAGESGPQGLFVTEVCGITADFNTDGTYWAFYVNGRPSSHGVDFTPVENGFEYTFAVE